MLLAGDIGGTKLHFGLFSRERGPRRPLAEAVYPSADHDSLEAAVRHFMGGTGCRATKAVLAVAGPVLGGMSQITNLPWVIGEARLRKTLNLRSAMLINDVEAVAASVPLLSRTDLVCLRRGKPVRRGNRAVVAPGTGLGEACLCWDGRQYRAFPSEGGHADFAPGTPLQDELLAFLRSRHGHVSVERVCSGIGIANLYRFLRDSGHAAEPPWLAEALARTGDPVPVIVEKALDPENPCDICVRALDLFASILGAEAGNLALKILATGGVYLGGGIPPRVLPFLEKKTFAEAFLRKGRMQDLVGRIPVYVITNPRAALLGAAALGLGPETRTRSRSSR
jgi:glucokinase